MEDTHLLKSKYYYVKLEEKITSFRCCFSFKVDKSTVGQGTHNF